MQWTEGPWHASFYLHDLSTSGGSTMDKWIICMFHFLCVSRKRALEAMEPKASMKLSYSESNGRCVWGEGPTRFNRTYDDMVVFPADMARSMNAVEKDALLGD